MHDFNDTKQVLEYVKMLVVLCDGNRTYLYIRPRM